jgi:hypothetical protein
MAAVLDKCDRLETILSNERTPGRTLRQRAPKSEKARGPAAVSANKSPFAFA